MDEFVPIAPFWCNPVHFKVPGMPTEVKKLPAFPRSTVPSNASHSVIVNMKQFERINQCRERKARWDSKLCKAAPRKRQDKQISRFAIARHRKRDDRGRLVVGGIRQQGKSSDYKPEIIQAVMEEQKRETMLRTIRGLGDRADMEQRADHIHPPAFTAGTPNGADAVKPGSEMRNIHPHTLGSEVETLHRCDPTVVDWKFGVPLFQERISSSGNTWALSEGKCVCVAGQGPLSFGEPLAPPSQVFL